MTLKHSVYILLLGFLSAGMNSCSGGSESKTAFVNLGPLIDGFHGKKEAEAKLENKYSREKHVLDSLALELETLQKQMGPGQAVNDKVVTEYRKKASVYQQLNEKVGEAYEKDRAEFADEVMKQVSAYVIEYGKENNYDYIFGAKGSGEIMYGKETLDITQKVLDYVNNRYNGKK